MKTSKKTKKLLGGIAIAAVSLGCLGLAGIANAAKVSGTTTGNTSPTASTGGGSSATTYPYYPSKTGANAIQNPTGGTTKITFNVSAAQGDTLSQHKLYYVQIGSYFATGSSDFQVVSSSQDAANAIGAWAKDYSATSSYDTSDGDPLTWLLTGDNGSSYLGTDLSGQATDSLSMAVRALANSLSNQTTMGTDPATDPMLGTPTLMTLSTPTQSTTSPKYYEETWDAPAPGIYLVLDQDGSGNNAALPMIVATEPGGSFTVPSNMSSLITNSVALKTQDPQAAPDKQFVMDAKGSSNPVAWIGRGSSATVSGGALSQTASSTVGQANAMTYQVAGIFPNYTGYQSYTYSFVDNPGTGLTLNIAGGNQLDVAGVALSTLMGKVSAKDVTVTETFPSGNSNSTITADSASALDNLKVLPGGSGAQLKVTLNLAALEELVTLGAKSTSITTNDGINDGSALTTYTVHTPASGTEGQDGGATSWTGQTSPAQYFGLDYTAYLNSKLTTTTSGTAQATNTASVINNGEQSGNSSTVPLTSSGTYNGTNDGKSTVNSSGDTTTSNTNPGTTTQTSPSNPTSGTTNGVPNKDAIGAGLTWMKIWGSGQVATGATFTVQNDTQGSQYYGQYLYDTGFGWGWTSEAGAEIFGATTLDSSTTQQAKGGLFQISGLGAGTYTVKEHQGAAYQKGGQTVHTTILPSANITIAAGQAEKMVADNGYNLVNNTPDGNPFNSVHYDTIENVKSLTGLPLTGGAGILTGVIAAVLLFGTAGIVLVVYRRRKSQED
ncbi:MAG: hypothetical protein IKS61_00320 [Aeriscardovia sp.]|nr:hypothetical protein [Aeriscardovia sp.]